MQHKDDKGRFSLKETTSPSEEVASAVKGRYKILPFIYENGKTVIDLVCPTHGLFQREYKSLVYKGRGCPDCFKWRNYESDLEKIENVRAEGYTLNLTEPPYINDDVISVSCKHGNRDVTFRHIRSGKFRCSKCLYTKPYNEWLQYYKDRWGSLYQYPEKISGNYNSSSIIDITCTTHGKFKKSLGKHRNQGCPKCSIENLKPHNPTLADRNKKAYLKTSCSLYIIKFTEGYYKIGISKDTPTRFSTIKRESKKDFKVVKIIPSNLYTCIKVEDFIKTSLTKVSGDITKFTGYTELFSKEEDIHKILITLEIFVKVLDDNLYNAS